MLGNSITNLFCEGRRTFWEEKKSKGVMEPEVMGFFWVFRLEGIIGLVMILKQRHESFMGGKSFWTVTLGIASSEFQVNLSYIAVWKVVRTQISCRIAKVFYCNYLRPIKLCLLNKNSNYFGQSNYASCQIRKSSKQKQLIFQIFVIQKQFCAQLFCFGFSTCCFHYLVLWLRI